MSAKTQTRNVVEFLTASSELAQAYRYAARRIKGFTRLASLYEINQYATAYEATRATIEAVRQRASRDGLVVLAHADEDHVLQENAKIATMLPSAFFLLFTAPTTHPDRIVQWIRHSKIRSETRVHVVQFAELESPNVSHLLKRVC